ncbi:MAG: polysaccharide pyruvyl transferase family protein [Desulfuromonadales bacterium]
MKSLKLYWSTSLQNGRKNFGDWLSPVLCEALSGLPVVHAYPNRCDLMAIGSILAKAKNHFWNRRLDVWGSGLIADIGAFDSPHRLHAVRGWKTAAAIRNRRVAVVGDPGLLADRLVPANVGARKQWGVGLVPHYVDQDNPLIHDFLARAPGAKFIDIFSGIEDFIRQVAACEVVLSSSMHGLIVADALGVPNAWIRLSGKVWGNDFKFHDYYSVFGIEPEPFPFDPQTRLADVLALADAYRRPGLERIKRDLVAAFPYKRSA